MRYLSILFLLWTPMLQAQIYDDYVGAGHSEGLTVTSSSTPSNGETGESNTTVNGAGLRGDEYAAARFLGYASLGADMETIEEVADLGVSTWLDQQFDMPPQVNFQDTTWMIWEYFKQRYVNKWGYYTVANASDAVIPYWYYWKMAWWNNIMYSDDHLRQRVAQAYSEVFVISEKSNLQLSGPGMADYYDMLYEGAFGNYRDLLYNISMHPCMGMYLSHNNNPKTDAANNVHPDENYAREIMQLFSIGLYDLNIDGTRKLDTGGVPIPSYDNDDIKEFAKIFTGLSIPGYWWPWEDYSAYPVEWDDEFNFSPSTCVMWEPMIAFDNWHEPGPKYLLNGTIVPGGNTLSDVNAAIDNLFNHPNVGPFIGRLLIQRLVKSNPTPEYIARVAGKFNNNGSGVRGDMRAVIRAILTDQEAQDCSWIDDPHSGKLREPLLRYTQAMKAFNAYNNSGRMWNWGYLFDEAVSQGILASPSVFNFFLPDFQPNGEIGDADLVAPEFQIHTDATAVNFINLAYDWFINEYYMEVSTTASNTVMNAPGYEPSDLKPIDYVYLDLTDELALANDATALVDRLDLLLTGGALSTATKATIVSSVNQLSTADEKVKAALFLTFISPDYSVQK